MKWAEISNAGFIHLLSLIAPEELPRIKILTNELEERWAVNGERKVNLDPGPA